MRSSAPLLLFSLVLVGCDNKETPTPQISPSAARPLATAPAEAAAPLAAQPGEAGAPTDAGSPADAAPWDAAMPPRPVPKTSPTVGSGAPMDTQLKAIAYMAAMRSPHPDDAIADAAYAENLAAQLKPIVMSMDKGPDKEKLNRVEIIGGGRQIDLLLSSGCDQQAPTNAVVQRAGVQLSTLLSHGVLVVRCNDSRAQCLQSTRDPTDVLCTTAPRHR